MSRKISVFFFCDPTCDATDGTYSNNLWVSTVGNVLNTPLNHRYPTAGTGYANGWIYTAPIPNISGGGTVTSPDGLGTWNVVLQNQSNTVPAANSYLYVSPKNGFTNIVVREGMTTILPDANGFYRLGNIGANSTRNLTITARTLPAIQTAWLLIMVGAAMTIPHHLWCKAAQKVFGLK